MPGSILFLTETEAATGRFIHEYVLGAMNRGPEIEGCEGISFDRDEQRVDDGDSVTLVVFGDFEAFVASEQERWKDHQTAGLIETWETNSLTDEQLAWKFGEQGAELAKRLLPLGGEMGKLAYQQFDDEPFPHPVDGSPGDNGWMPVSWWTVLHHLTVGNLGYSPSDEIDMCVAAIEEDLRIIAERTGEEAVDAKIDNMIDTLEGLREDVKDGRPRPEASSSK